MVTTTATPFSRLDDNLPVVRPAEEQPSQQGEEPVAPSGDEGGVAQQEDLGKISCSAGCRGFRTTWLPVLLGLSLLAALCVRQGPHPSAFLSASEALSQVPPEAAYFPAPRKAAFSGLMGGKFFVFSGRGRNQVVLDDLWHFDLRGDLWRFNIWERFNTLDLFNKSLEASGAGGDEDSAAQRKKEGVAAGGDAVWPTGRFNGCHFSAKGGFMLFGGDGRFYGHRTNLADRAMQNQVWRYRLAEGWRLLYPRPREPAASAEADPNSGASPLKRSAPACGFVNAWGPLWKLP